MVDRLPSFANEWSVVIAGVAFSIDADAATAPAMHQLLALAAPTDTAPTVRLTVRLRDEPLPRTPATELYGTVSLWRDGDELVVDSGCGVTARAGRTLIDIGGDAAGPRFEVGVRRALHHALSHVLSLGGRLVLHAAAVARDGEAVLLLGPTGAGKSTMAYAAGAGGWDIVADDLVALWQESDGVRLLGIPRALNIPADALGAGGEPDRGSPLSGDARERRRFAAPLTDAPARVRAVGIVSHGDADGTVTRAAGQQVFPYVIGSAPAAGHAAVARTAFLLAGALMSAPAWNVGLPDTPERRHARVPELLDAMASDASGA